MTQTREHIEGHFEVEGLTYGRVYKWSTGHALVECENCGQILIVDTVTTTCSGCDADYTTLARGLEGKSTGSDEA